MPDRILVPGRAARSWPRLAVVGGKSPPFSASGVRRRGAEAGSERGQALPEDSPLLVLLLPLL
eukprot:6862353-Pyramimonas_sp.AAC.1